MGTDTRKRFTFYIAAIGIICCQFGTPNAQVFVDPSAELVTWEGWGTSLCWWPDVLGAMPEDVIDQVTRAFFSPDELNLNIVRYTIGGTTPGEYPCGPYRDGAATESFLDGPESAYDWTRDPRQRQIMMRAKDLGADTFEAFSNSPPAWMTISGCSKGNDEGAPLHNNFDSANASAFADYATEVIKHYHDVWNITFQTYAPFNEPSGYYGNGYWTGSGSRQEGCSMTYEVMADVLRAMDAAIKAKNLDYVKLTIADETVMNLAAQTHQWFFEQGLTPLAEKINTHGYSDDGRQNRDLLHIRARRDGMRLWMDEIGWSEGQEGEVDQALTVAERIITDIRELLPSAWVYWQAMEDAGAWGLIGVPYRDPSLGNIRYNSGFYGMKQFSKYIQKGATLIQINERYSIAAYDARSKSLIIVILNQSTDPSPELVYDLSLFSIPASIEATRSSKFEQNSAIDAPALAGNTFTYSAEGRSITTLVFSDIEPVGVPEATFSNGDFENGLQGWIVSGTGDGIAQSDYAFRGSRAAYLNATTGMVKLSQVFSVENTRVKYFLTAWCRTQGDDMVLGARVFSNGDEGTEHSVTLRSDNNFGSYGLTFEFDSSQADQVEIFAVQNSGIAYVDEMVLSKVVLALRV